jgi:hypothetical protein
MHTTLDAHWFRVEVRHRCSPPKRYTWEIYCKDACLPVEESRAQFGSWEEASRAGTKALTQFLQGRFIGKAADGN